MWNEDHGVTYAVRKTRTEPRYVILAVLILLLVAAAAVIALSVYESWRCCTRTKADKMHFPPI